MNTFDVFIGFCIGALAAVLLQVGLAQDEPRFDHAEFIAVCIATNGVPRLVEADVDGLVMNCLYESTSTDYNETRKDARA